MSALADRLADQIATAGYEPPSREYRFAPPRRWRFDFAWPECCVAVEVEGGTWIGGAHSRGARFYRDAEKYNEATFRGWRVYRVTSDMIRNGMALTVVERALGEC